MILDFFKTRVYFYSIMLVSVYNINLTLNLSALTMQKKTKMLENLIVIFQTTIKMLFKDKRQQK